MIDLFGAYREPAEKVLRQERISREEAEFLASVPLSLLSVLATSVKERKSGKNVFYNRNFHVEPTNLCVFNCRFCSYRRPAGAPDAWDYSVEEIMEQVEAHCRSGATEIHIVGGVHPRKDLYYYADLIRKIRERIPSVAVKAFTAIELAYMIDKAELSYHDGLAILKEAGMQAIPGGGAEIFDEKIRKQICPEKGSAETWLAVHREAHRIGLKSNATILYGHIEQWADRIDHLDRLRSLQDETDGFDAFIPLKYRNRHNSMSELGEVSVVEDMRMMAMARIYLDNFPHIKAYWPMFGKTTAQLALAFGADDMDGTIDDSTKIYSMAGAEDRKPSMSASEMERMIRDAGYEPVERDTFYHPVKK